MAFLGFYVNDALYQNQYEFLWLRIAHPNHLSEHHLEQKYIKYLVSQARTCQLDHQRLST